MPPVKAHLAILWTQLGGPQCVIDDLIEITARENISLGDKGNKDRTQRGGIDQYAVVLNQRTCSSTFVTARSTKAM